MALFLQRGRRPHRLGKLLDLIQILNHKGPDSNFLGESYWIVTALLREYGVNVNGVNLVFWAEKDCIFVCVC
jgi:hypothetical protein